MGATFAFDARAFGPDFSLFPVEGFAPPNRDVTLEATFHPTKITDDARVDRAVCRVDGAGELELTLGGRCVAQKAEEDVVEFRAGARMTDAKEVSVSNPTAVAWRLKPTVTGEHWSGADFWRFRREDPRRTPSRTDRSRWPPRRRRTKAR